jgi:hypothetical protein
MSKLLRISTIILAFFATISFTFAQTVVKLTKAERILNGLDKTVDLSPGAIYADPYLLNNYWAEKAPSTDKYFKDAVEWQEELNKRSSKNFVLAHCDIDDKIRYKEDNYKLPIEQREIDNEPITPYTWKIIEFQRVNLEDSSFTIATLQRPNWWSKQIGADKVGNKVYLNISEQGISGNFTVTEITPVQLDTRFWKWKVKDGYVGRPITGKFEHKSYDVWEFEFDNGEIIGCTPTHPFYSERRQAYIPVGQLEIGEPIKNKEGKTIAIKSKKKKSGGETVYNLEVYRDHNFMVGYSGLLVHNSCVGIIEELVNNRIKYTNLFKTELFWSKQFPKSIKSSIESAKNSANIGTQIEGKVADAIAAEHSIEAFGVKIKDSGNVIRGEIDVITENAIVEVKASASVIKEDQIAKLIQEDHEFFINPYKKKVIVYIDDINTSVTHSNIQMLKNLPISEGISLEIIIGNLPKLVKAVK